MSGETKSKRIIRGGADRSRAKRAQEPLPELVRDVRAFIRSYVVMDDAKLLVVALWIIHTHSVEIAEQTPYLAITSPEKQCGKSRLLDVLDLLAARAWLVSLPSEAVVYRYIEATTPTMLLDEVDAIFNPRTADRYEGLRALLNNGHRRGAKVPRCVGTSHALHEFSTFCPKALAGIGTLPDTVADRSIPIRLERKTRDEKVERFLRGKVEPEAEALRERIEAWTEGHRDALAGAEPAMPEELSDRMQEGCECLVAIGDEIGCGEAARSALVALFATERLDDQESMRLRLLRDIRAVFEDRSNPRSIRTDSLIDALIRIPDAPWLHYYGRGVEARDLSSLLGHYGISPTTVNLGGGQRAKGYKRDDFHEAWTRYL